MQNIHKYLIVVAGGSGLRMGKEVPKQFLLLKGYPVLMHSIDRFITYDRSIEVILVLPEGHITYWENMCREHRFNTDHHIIAGGKERFHSVKNGLVKIIKPSLVAIHDGVRPLVSNDTIERCFNTAEQSGNAIPVITPPESIREIDLAGENRPLDRDTIKLIQTPQVFRSEILHNAYKQEFKPGFTDDASVVESMGVKIKLVDGNTDNIKITTPGDLIYAESILDRRLKIID